MLTVITGGSGSGKSAYAENYISDTALKYDNYNKYYIATMKVYDDEGQKRSSVTKISVGEKSLSL